MLARAVACLLLATLAGCAHAARKPAVSDPVAPAAAAHAPAASAEPRPTLLAAAAAHARRTSAKPEPGAASAAAHVQSDATPKPLALARTPLTAAGPDALRYTVEVDAALRALSVRLCFDGPSPQRLVYGGAQALPFLRSPRIAESGSQPGRELRVVDGHIVLDGLAADGCIRYGVDLAAAIEHDALLLAYPGQGAVVLATELFLYRPVHRSAGLHASLRFVLPKGVDVSAPWRRREDEYVLTERAFAFTGHIALGRLVRERVGVPGAQLDIALLPGFSDPARGLILAWLKTAGDVVSMPAGHFPVPHAQLLVVPTSASSFPIHFGYTGRSGGASIVLFMPTDVERAQLHDDWIAIHEFSHLLHPFVRRSDAWLSEGLATYLQEVLRVQAGLLSKREAWRRLYQGALLGRDTDEGLEQQTRIMPHAHNYQRVYGAGAAIALMADVELRRETHGRVTLEGVLGKLSERALHYSHSARAKPLLRTLDELAGVKVFEPIAQRYLHGGPMPDLTALYRELGLLDASGKVRAQPDGPLGWVADAIMARKPGLSLPLSRSPG